VPGIGYRVGCVVSGALLGGTVHRILPEGVF